MKNKKINIILFALSLVLGIIVMSFYKTSSSIVEDGIVSTDKIDELRAYIDDLEIQKRELKDNVEVLENNIKNIEKQFEENETLYDEMQNDLNKYKILSGGFDVEGPGVIITINEPISQDSFMQAESIVNNYQHILSIISYLNSGGAEAVSINDQRYTSYTEIVPVGNTLNINGKRIVAPIEIKAIGDPRTLEATVNFVGGIAEQLKFMGFDVKVEKSEKVEVGAIADIKKFDHAVLYESMEE